MAEEEGIVPNQVCDRESGYDHKHDDQERAQHHWAALGRLRYLLTRDAISDLRPVTCRELLNFFLSEYSNDR